MCKRGALIKDSCTFGKFQSIMLMYLHVLPAEVMYYLQRSYIAMYIRTLSIYPDEVVGYCTPSAGYILVFIFGKWTALSGNRTRASSERLLKFDSQSNPLDPTAG